MILLPPCKTPPKHPAPKMTATIGTAVAAAAAKLEKLIPRQTAWLEAEVLTAFVCKQNRTWLVAHNTDRLSPTQHRRLTALVQKRLGRWPIAYLTGQKDFFGRNFAVTSAVLIPRPETELLVEIVLQTPGFKTVADIGTGSGCIAVTLAAEQPNLKIFATDISTAALAIAKRNAHKHRVTSRITFRQGDLLQPLVKIKLDAVIANLPYVTTAEYSTSPSIKREPKLALAAGTDGLRLYRQLFKQLADRPRQPSYLFLEIGSGQGRAIKQLLQQVLPQYTCELKRDLAGRVRLVIAKLIK